MPLLLTCCPGLGSSAKGRRIEVAKHIGWHRLRKQLTQQGA